MSKTYFTIFLGDSPWENVVDDMAQSKPWGVGSMYWDDRAKADACVWNLKNPIYGFEEEGKLFSVVEFEL